MLLNLFSWEEFYGQNIVQFHFQNKEFQYKSPALELNSQGNTYVYNCYFHDLSATDGGAILYSIANSFFLVEKSFFHRCNASRYTGAIRVTAGNCIIAYVCGQSCISSKNDAFSSISMDTSIKISSVIDSSVSFCEATSQHIVYHQYGHVYIKSVNLSYNKAQSTSALRCGPNQINQETGYGADVIFCSFLNNTATSTYCIFLEKNNLVNKFQIKNCNIVENAANKTIYSKGETDISLSLLINNAIPYLFPGDATSKISLFFCNIDETESESFTNENQITNQFILSLPHLQSGFCAIRFNYCTENSFLQNLYIHKIVIPSPFIFLLLSNKK